MVCMTPPPITSSEIYKRMGFVALAEVAKLTDEKKIGHVVPVPGDLWARAFQELMKGTGGFIQADRTIEAFGVRNFKINDVIVIVEGSQTPEMRSIIERE